MLQMIRERPLDRITDFPGILDLQEMLAIPKIQACTHIWTNPDGRMTCFAILDRNDTSAALIFEVAPDWSGKPLEEEVIAWAEASIRQTSPPPTGTFFLEASSRSDNSGRIALLERLRFQPQAGGAVHMERSLADPIAKPQLPAGFSIRPIRGEAEAKAWVRLHQAALGTANITTEYKLAMMQTPYYDPELDLVAVTRDGTLAAYCVCFINVEENALTAHRNGYTDPVATHPAFQRRGLSKALMNTGLCLLKERHMETACLGTSNANIAMLHAAESVGFHITKTVLWYNKPVNLVSDKNG